MRARGLLLTLAAVLAGTPGRSDTPPSPPPPPAATRPKPTPAPVLERGGSIEGVVRDGDTGEPVVGVRVETSDKAGNRVGRIQATTDAEGRFRLAGLGPGRHDVSAGARGRGHAFRSAVPLGARVELLLQPTATVQGIVTGPGGKPLAGATVTALGFRSVGGPRSGPTDAQGRYEVTGLTAGFYTVAVRAPRLAPGVVSDVVLEARGEAQVDVTLRPGAQVRGRLVDANDKALAGDVSVAEVGGRPVPYVLSHLLRGKAASDGRFAIDAVPVGEHALGTDVPGQAPQRVEFSVTAAQSQVDVGDVRMEAGLTIRGRVRTQSGQPVSDATVQASGTLGPAAKNPPPARTDAEGAFVLAGLEPVRYQLAAIARGYSRSDSTAEPGPDPIEFVLEPAGSITGKVEDDRGRALEAFRVVASPLAERRPGSFKQFESSDGRFVLDEVAAGDYVVTVTAVERGSAGVSPVKVASAGSTDIGTVKLGAGATVRGTVVDAGGSYVAGARITLSKRRTEWVSFDGEEILTDRSGAFEAKGVEPGAFEVTAAHVGYAPSQPVQVVVDPAQPTPDLRFVLTRGGRIEGSLRRRDGAPIAGVLVSVTPARQDAWRNEPLQPTRADGSFVFEHVPAGRVRLMTAVSTGAGMYRSAQFREIEVSEGETAAVDIVSREILLSGRATRSGVPAPGLHLEARTDRMVTFGGHGGPVSPAAGGPERMRAVTREDGGFEMLVDEPGPLRLMVTAADGRHRLGHRFLLVPDAETHAIDLTLSGVPVSGMVIDAETESPIPYASVSASPREPRREREAGGTAGPDGRFELELEPAEYRLGAAAREAGYAQASIDIGVGPGGLADVRVPLPRGLRITGKTFDPAGRPATGVEVHAMGTAGGGHADAAPDGSFEIRGLRPGTYALNAWSDTGLFAIERNVSAGRLDVPVRLRAGGLLVVETVASDGRPVPGAWARVSSVDGVPVYGMGGSTTTTNAQGTAEMRAPAGHVVLTAGKDRMYGRTTVDVSTGETVAVKITLEERP